MKKIVLIGMTGFEYPLPVSRKRYVTEIGGYSELIDKKHIGLHFAALASKTNLSPGDEVVIDTFHDNHKSSKSSTQSLFAKNVYHVKPITDFNDSRLLAMSSDGEAILSKENPVKAEIGKEIILNATINRLPDNWVGKIIKKYIKSRNSTDTQSHRKNH